MSSSWSVEAESQAPAARLFKGGFVDWHNLGPKLLPEIFAGITILSGDGGPGTIRQVYLTAAAPFSFVKERIDSIDYENHEMEITVLEGGNLGNTVESINNRLKVETRGTNSVVKMEQTYKTISDADISADIQKLKEAFIVSVKAVEGYLLANPDTYN